MPKEKIIKEIRWSILYQGENLGFWQTEYGWTHLLFQTEKEANQHGEDRNKLYETPRNFRVVAIDISYLHPFSYEL